MGAAHDDDSVCLLCGVAFSLSDLLAALSGDFFVLTNFQFAAIICIVCLLPHLL